MAYGNMTPASSGGVASSAANNQIIANVEDLDTRLDATEALTTAAGATAAGNAALSARLGTVSSASPAGTRLTALETKVNNSATLGSGNDAMNARLTAVASATGGSKPLAVLLRTSNQTITTATWTAVMFTSEALDTANGHDNTTQNTRYVGKVAGWYKVGGLITASAVAGSVAAQVYKNGSGVVGSGYSSMYAGNTAVFRSTYTEVFVPLNGTSDYVELRGYVTPGTAFEAEGAGAGLYMNVEWLAPL